MAPLTALWEALEIVLPCFVGVFFLELCLERRQVLQWHRLREFGSMGGLATGIGWCLFMFFR